MRSLLPYILILFASACIDRLSFNLEKPIGQGIAISGYISDQPGPYEVKVYSIFDIESKESMKTPVTVRSMELSDNFGHQEQLSELSTGIYQTKATGIKGVVGGVYKLRIELFDGKIYESLPDTILPTGSLDSMYFNFTEEYNIVGEKKYGFDVLFDATYNSEINSQFIWKFNATFQAETEPEKFNGQACFYLEEINRCNFVPPCSGYRNVGTNVNLILEQQYACTCCQCWHTLYNDDLIISDDLFTKTGSLKNVKVRNVPLNQWTLLHKTRVEVGQYSLTKNSFRFWKSIRDQKTAIDNLFQPMTGIITSNFVQISGPPVPAQGIFYATSISNKIKYVKQFELPPDLVYQISLDKPFFGNDCRLLFPNSTIFKPSFWED